MQSDPPSTGPVIFISAGEASGEHYGALLATSIQQQLAPKGETAELYGMGGPRMEAAGVRRVVRAEDMAVMGITEIVLHLPRIYREFQKLKQAIRAHPPSVAILIDFPDIHLRLAREFKRLGVPVIFFVSPQLWAWKQHRIKLVREFVKRMLVIFPFEVPFYRSRGVAAEFVGHPLADLPLPSITRRQFASVNNLDPARTWIGLLPGSRLTEIRDHLPTMLDAARGLPESASFEFLIPLAPTLDAAQRATVTQLVHQHDSGLSVHLISDAPTEGLANPTSGGARAVLYHARASVVASGTATVEAALIGNPFVVVYHVSPVTYAIAKRVVKVPHVAMANLIAGKRVVPELIQHDFTASNLVQHLVPLLPDGTPRQSMKMELEAIRKALRGPSAQPGSHVPGAIERVANIVVEEISAAPQAALAAAPH
ncbi:MAG: lipid-A-disaccharide synthase [Terracidiphilus sp.]